MPEEEIENLPNLAYAHLNVLDALCQGEIAAYLNSEGFAQKPYVQNAAWTTFAM